MLHKAFASLLVLALLAAPAFAAGSTASAHDAASSWSATLTGFVFQALDYLGLTNADAIEFRRSADRNGSTVSDAAKSVEIGASPQPNGAANEFVGGPDPGGLTETDEYPSNEIGASPEPGG